MRAIGKVSFQLKALSIFPSNFKCQIRGHRVSRPQNFTDYESIKQQYSLQIPEYFNFAEDVLDVWAEKEKVEYTLFI